MKQKQFIFDLNRCTGCGACIVACSTENIGKQTLNWREVYTFNESHHPRLPLFNLSMACNHCGLPACLKNCPASAYVKDSKTGAVTVNPDRCIGCKYCTWACPYDAPRYNKEKGVIEKCDFCSERLKNNEAPACVCACPTNALRIEDSQPGDRPAGNIEGFTDIGLQPAIRFKPLRQRHKAPESTAPPSDESINKLFASSLNIPPSKITLKSEWTLLVFTSIAFILVALLTAAVTTPLSLNPFLFLAAGTAGMGLSTVHLGKKSRAFRAILNIKTSWLSREIFLFPAFLGISTLYLLFFPTQQAIGWAAVITGFLSLFAVDRLYQLAMQTGPGNFHSAHTFFNGLYLAGILTAGIHIYMYTIYGGAGLIKLVLYLHRKRLFKKTNRTTRPLVSILRIAFGFIFPLIIFIFYPEIIKNDIIGPRGLMILSVLTGELIDRTEYYDELDVITPRKQMLIDLENVLRVEERRKK